MSSDEDQADRSLEEKAHVVDVTRPTAGAIESIERPSAVLETEPTNLKTERTGASSTLADESSMECDFDEPKGLKRHPSRRGRRRSKAYLKGGVRSRSVSVTKSWKNKRVTFWSEVSADPKAGISVKKARSKRARERCTKTDEKRKDKLNEIRFAEPSASISQDKDLGGAAVTANPTLKENLAEKATRYSEDLLHKTNVQNADETEVEKLDQLVEKVSELTLITLGLQKHIVELRTEVGVLRADSFKNRSAEVRFEKNLTKEVSMISKEVKMSKEIIQKVCPVKINDVHYKSQDKLITKEFLNQEPQVNECDLEMDSVQFMAEEEPEELPKNFEYLRKCFIDQIGIDMERKQTRNIFNFDETLIAKGFERVVVTWQGMFWEHSHDDISFRNLKKDQFPPQGFESWSAKGVKVFRVTKPCRRSKPFAHRFAVKPPDDFRGVCNPLEVGKYYSHVYQTKVLVGREMRTLRSKLMAR